jgi:hypothetical protein
MILKVGRLLLVLAAVGLLGAGTFAIGVNAADTASVSFSTARQIFCDPRGSISPATRPMPSRL